VFSNTLECVSIRFDLLIRLRAADDCFAGGEVGTGKCTWCKVSDPEMQFCTSSSLWDELVSTQDKVEGDKIRLYDVFHCSTDPKEYNEDDSSNKKKKNGNGSVFDTKCTKAGGSSVNSPNEKRKCIQTAVDFDGVQCTIDINPFGGLMDSTSGQHCMSKQQQRVINWAVKLLIELGWTMTGDDITEEGQEEQN
jgi:hypothetical protein